MSESYRRAGLLRAGAESVARVAGDWGMTAKAIADPATRDRLRKVTKPNSLSRTLRRTGVALILAPDPVTAVPGVAMLGASFAMRGRDPISPAAVFEEADKLIEEMGSLF